MAASRVLWGLVASGGFCLAFMQVCNTKQNKTEQHKTEQCTPAARALRPDMHLCCWLGIVRPPPCMGELPGNVTDMVLQHSPGIQISEEQVSCHAKTAISSAQSPCYHYSLSIMSMTYLCLTGWGSQVGPHQWDIMSAQVCLAQGRSCILCCPA